MSTVFLRTLLAVVGCVALLCPSVLCQVNLALNRPARQSSTFERPEFPAQAESAVDGNNNTRFLAESCSRTLDDFNAWWVVDLGFIYDVESVAITREEGDSTTESIFANFNIEVSAEQETNGDLIRPRLCALRRNNPPPVGETTNIPCVKGARGRYVRIRLQNKNILTLCEVEIFGKRATQCQRNIALRKPATQISLATLASGFAMVAGLAVDGNNNPDVKAESCAHTRYESDAWWRVDLGQNYYVESVTVNRLNIGPDFKIEVSAELKDNGEPLNPRLCVERISNPPPEGVSTSMECNQGAVGRYLHFQNMGSGDLVLCELEAFGIPLLDADLALSRFAVQSSILFTTTTAQEANGPAFDRCAKTNIDVRPFWWVDLEGMYQVVEVVIRADSISDFKIETSRYRNGDYVDLVDPCLCAYEPNTLTGTRSYHCRPDAVGQFVRIQIQDDQSLQRLNLCEVRVFGYPAACEPRPPKQIPVKPWQCCENIHRDEFCPGFSYVSRSMWDATPEVAPVAPVQQFASDVLVMVDFAWLGAGSLVACRNIEDCSAVVRYLQTHGGDADIHENFLVSKDSRIYIGLGWDAVDSSSRSRMYVGLLAKRKDGCEEVPLLKSAAAFLQCLLGRFNRDFPGSTFRIPGIDGDVNFTSLRNNLCSVK